MKVAFATSSGAVVDGNFRKADSFTVWDIGPDDAYYVTTINIRTDADIEDDRMAIRAEAFKECAIVCAVQISGPAAAKLIARNIHPMKTGSNIGVEEIIQKLQITLKGSHAPWMQKVQKKWIYGHDTLRVLDGGA